MLGEECDPGKAEKGGCMLVSKMLPVALAAKRSSRLLSPHLLKYSGQ